jgi:hypothetical protein
VRETPALTVHEGRADTRRHGATRILSPETRVRIPVAVPQSLQGLHNEHPGGETGTAAILGVELQREVGAEDLSVSLVGWMCDGRHLHWPPSWPVDADETDAVGWLVRRLELCCRRSRPRTDDDARATRSSGNGRR